MKEGKIRIRCISVEVIKGFWGYKKRKREVVLEELVRFIEWLDGGGKK